MFEFWRQVLPGLGMLSWRSYMVGVAENYLYGWYFALVWVPLYDFFIARERT